MTNLKSDNQVGQLTDFIDSAKDILVFTGAGISTESGISDYRSKGGLWDRFQPVTIQEFVASEEKRIEYWRRKLELYGSMKDAQPNAGHKAIRDIEKLGKLKGIVTQNIDGLHHMAGNSPEKILEIHGSNRQTVCLSCGDLRPWQEVYKRLESGEKAPLCNLSHLRRKTTCMHVDECKERVARRDVTKWASCAYRRDNPEEYAEIIKENFGISYPVKFEEFPGLYPWNRPAISKGESGYIQVPRACPLGVPCSGFLKPNTISFGQELNPRVLEDSLAWAKSCDLLLAIGSTLIVEPAASIPRIAKSNGAKLVIITLSQTPLDDYADLKITDSVGKILNQTVSINLLKGTWNSDFSKSS